jgi:hypothetical protein
MLLFYVNCRADGYPKNNPVFTGDSNDPGFSIMDCGDYFFIIEYDDDIYYYPIE